MGHAETGIIADDIVERCNSLLATLTLTTILVEETTHVIKARKWTDIGSSVLEEILAMLAMLAETSSFRAFAVWELMHKRRYDIHYFSNMDEDAFDALAEHCANSAFTEDASKYDFVNYIRTWRKEGSKVIGGTLIVQTSEILKYLKNGYKDSLLVLQAAQVEGDKTAEEFFFGSPFLETLCVNFNMFSQFCTLMEYPNALMFIPHLSESDMKEAATLRRLGEEPYGLRTYPAMPGSRTIIFPNEDGALEPTNNTTVVGQEGDLIPITSFNETFVYFFNIAKEWCAINR